MQFHSASSACRADPAIVDVAAESWEAHSSVIGLEAALGACREKALELELRLRNAEDRMQLQVRTHKVQLLASMHDYCMGRVPC